MIKLSDFDDLLEEALELLGSSPVGRVKISDKKRKVSLARFGGNAVSAEPGSPVISSIEQTYDDTDGVRIDSPAVGVVSLADSGRGQPSISIGKDVRRGQVIATISALDVSKVIESPVDGLVAEVFVEDGDGVEFGAPLFIIKPHS